MRSRGLPSVMKRPRSMIASRAHRRSASSMKCVVRTMVLPLGEELPQPLPDEVARLRVEARGGLVHEDQSPDR